MEFQLLTPTRLKLKNASPRKEVHGDELVQAIDVQLEWETSNECLAMFDGWLLDALYCRTAATQAQKDVPGVPGTVPNLRLSRLEMPLKWDLELKGRDFRIAHGLGGRSDLILATSTIGKFRLTAKEGGTTVIAFRVQCNVDVSEKVVGKLCALEGAEVEATLTTSDEAGDAQVSIEDAATPAAKATAKGSPKGADDGGLWPFPRDQAAAPAEAAATPPPAAAIAPSEPGTRTARGREATEKHIAARMPVKYRNEATGETWSGRGLKPKWLVAAIELGASLASFEVATP